MQVDGIEIIIESDAKKACVELDKMIAKLTQVNNALSSVSNNTKMNSMSKSIRSFSSAIGTMKDVKTSDINKITKSFEKLNNINTNNLQSLSARIYNMSSAIGKINGVSTSVNSINEFVKSISKLGGASTLKAIANMPVLANALKDLMSVLSKAPTVNRNLIDMTNALAKLSSQGSKVGIASKAINKNLDNYNSKLKTTKVRTEGALKSTRSLASAFGLFYANYFLIIRGIKSLGNAIKSTMDYIETYNYFNVIADKIGKEFDYAWKENGYSNAEEYANSFKQRLNELTTKMTGYNIGAEGGLYATDYIGLGLDPNAIMNYQASISSITNSVGLIGEMSIATSKALTMLSADMSSLKNIDLNTVMTNLQSGLIGQSKALYKYGIDITNTTLQAYALANGISKAVSEMTQSEKMQLRMIAILDQSKIAYGDMANTINGVANQYRVFQQQVSNLARTVGALFIPILQKTLPYINAMVVALQRLFTWIGNIIGVDWSSLMDGISNGYTDTGLEDLLENSEDLADGLDDATSAAKKLNKQLAGFDEITSLSTNDSTSGSSSVSGGGGVDLSEAITDALTDYESVWDKAFAGMENKVNGIADSISAYFVKIKDAWNNGAELSFVGSDIGEFINKSLENINWGKIKLTAEKSGKALSTILNGIISSVDGEVLGKTISEYLNTIVTFFNSAVVNFDFKEFGSKLASGINGLFKNFDAKKLSKTVADALKGILTTPSTFLDETDFAAIGRKIGTFLENLDLGEVSFKLAGVLWKSIKSAFELLGGMFDQAQIETMLLVLFGLLKFTPIGNLVSVALTKALQIGISKALTKAFGVSSFAELGVLLTTGISSALASLGGIGGLLTMDLATIIGAGTLAEIGLALAGGIFSGILAGIAGWNLGQKIYEATSGEEIDMSFSEQMNMIGSSFTDGSWKGALKLWGKDISDGCKEVGKSISNWFTTSVAPWFTKKKWSDLFSSIKSELVSEWNELTSWWKSSAIGKWWNQNVSPWFTKQRWSNTYENMKTSLDLKWSETVTWWESSAMSKWWSSSVEPWFNESKWTNLYDRMRSALVTKWNQSSVWWESSAMSKWWSSSVEPWFNESKWTNLYDRMRSALVTKWGQIYSWWQTSTLTNWWNQSVSPWFTTSRWISLFDTIRYSLQQKWVEVSNWWKSSALYKWWNEDVSPWFRWQNWNFSGIKDGLSTAFNNAIAAVKQVWNTFANWLNGKLTWTIDPIKKFGVEIFSGMTINLGRIPTFQTGGFPEDGLFMANHNELVGKFSNGKTAVVNNEQILKGVSDGVYNAVSRAMSEISNNTNVNISLEGDTKGLFKAVQKEANLFNKRTNHPPFPT